MKFQQSGSFRSIHRHDTLCGTFGNKRRGHDETDHFLCIDAGFGGHYWAIHCPCAGVCIVADCLDLVCNAAVALVCGGDIGPQRICDHSKNREAGTDSATKAAQQS